MSNCPTYPTYRITTGYVKETSHLPGLAYLCWPTCATWLLPTGGFGIRALAVHLRKSR